MKLKMAVLAYGILDVLIAATLMVYFIIVAFGEGTHQKIAVHKYFAIASGFFAVHAIIHTISIIRQWCCCLIVWTVISMLCMCGLVYLISFDMITTFAFYGPMMKYQTFGLIVYLIVLCYRLIMVNKLYQHFKETQGIDLLKLEAA